MRIISIINQKGGCGKTTTAINLAGVFAKQGRRTLLVDLDPQSHCAAGLAIPEQRIDVQIGDAMLARPDQPIDWTRLLWRISRHLDLAPSTTRLAALESARGGLHGLEGAEKRLAGVLGRLKDQYDVCLIDCPPNIGLLTYNALAAADEVLVPVETAYFALQGAMKQVTALKSMAKRLELTPSYRVVATMHDPSSSLARDVLEELSRRFGENLIPVTIRFDHRVREAVSFGQPVVEYAGDASSAEDYTALAQWLLSDVGLMKSRPAVTAAQSKPTILPAALPAALPVATINEAKPSTMSQTLASSGSTLGRSALAGVTKAAASVARADVGTQASKSDRIEVKSAGVTGFTVSPARTVLNSGGTLVLENELGGGTGLGVPPVTLPEIAEPKTGGTGTLSAEEIRARLLELTSRVSKLAEKHRGDGSEFGGRAGNGGGNGAGVAMPPPLPAAAKPMGGSPISTIFGVRQTGAGVLFVQPLGVGNSVSIAGEFNGWQAQSAVMNRNERLGIHELLLPIAAGRYQYRLVIDGRWTHDVHNSISEPNPFGDLNSVLEVAPSKPRF